MVACFFSLLNLIVWAIEWLFHYHRQEEFPSLLINLAFKDFFLILDELVS
jgi:hypothetical protein